MRDERGSVTAEAAVLAPLGAFLVVVALWLVSLGLTQVRLVDAARDGARLVARGESEKSALELVRRSSPAGAQLRVARDGDLVVVTAEVRPRSPLQGWAPVLRARSVAAAE